MPNLKEKIGAQLKGVKKEELKDYLARTGYAQTAAAKVESSTLPSRKIPSLNIIIFVVLIIGIILYFSGFKFIAGEKFISLEEAAKESGYSENFLEQLAGEAKIGSKTKDGTVYISSDDLEALIQELNEKLLDGIETFEPTPLDEPSVSHDLPTKEFLISTPQSAVTVNTTPEIVSIPLRSIE